MEQKYLQELKCFRILFKVPAIMLQKTPQNQVIGIVPKLENMLSESCVRKIGTVTTVGRGYFTTSPTTAIRIEDTAIEERERLSFGLTQ